MKKIILFSLLLSTSAPARDCENCGFWDDWTLWLPMREVPEWPIEFVKVEKVEYPRNEDASFCKRPPEMVDTLVIHHSESGPLATAEEINTTHMNRGTPTDPWYMIAYSFVINSPYPFANTPAPKVTEGRPIELVGAHAGSNAYVPMNEEQQKMWDEGKIVCGKTGGEFKVDPKQLKNGKIKANVTTIGIVVVGNYSPFSKYNPNGYSPKAPRYPTKNTITLAAKMACQLQKKWPNIKNIKWHNLYNATSCPGNLKQKVPDIIKAAKELGCDFK